MPRVSRVVRGPYRLLLRNYEEYIYTKSDAHTMHSEQHTIRNAAIVFGITDCFLSLIWTVGISTTGHPTSRSLPFAVVVIVSTVIATLMGGLSWQQIVVRSDRWSVPTRGAIAGGVTIWESFLLLVPIVTLIDQFESITSPSVLIEAIGLMLLAGTVGMVFIGIFLVPFGIVIGYLLGRTQTADPGPLPILSRL